jgi:ferrochelatase
VPVSFVSEHIETLEEIDMEYKEVALKNGIEKWRRVPALNTNKFFLNDMADMVVRFFFFIFLLFNYYYFF